MTDPNTASMSEGELRSSLEMARARIEELETGRNIEQEALRAAIVRAAAVMALVTPVSVPLVPEYQRGWRDGYEGALRDVHRVLTEET